MQEIIVDLYISADQYQRLYAGTAEHVRAVGRDGRSIRFPARILRPFVTREGIRGSFGISFDSANKFQGIRRLA